MMEAKLLILLFKILICTLLISFKSEGQSVDGPQEVKVFDNYMDNAKLIDNMDDGQEMQRQLEEFEKILENPPNPQFQQLDDLSADQEMQRQLEELEKILENPPNPQFQQLDDLSADQQLQMQSEFEKSINNPTFDNINADLSELEKQMDELNKLAEDAANIKIPPLDFKVSDDDVNDFFSFKTLSRPRVILHYVALSLFAVLIIIGIARCVRKKTTSSPPSNRRLLLWLTLKKKDADQDESSGDGVGSQKSSGDAFGSQKSSGDKTRLMV
ncbi:UNVERIFIED_CONTAM: hypothetical protein RMT77_010980 [Armadillidium vulgare]